MSKEKQMTPYPLRIEPELRKVLEDAARENGRSLQAEIIARLAASAEYKSNSEIELEEKMRLIALEAVRVELAKAGIRSP